MEIYIEDAILQNVVVTYLLLKLTERSVCQNKNFWKTFFSSIVGCIFSIILTFFNLLPWYKIAFKLCAGFIICLCDIKKFQAKKIFLFFNVFLTFTFVMGGLCFAINNLFETNIGLFILSIFILIFYIILNNIVNFVYLKRKITNFYYNVKLQKDNINFDIRAYLDSGNLLQDEETGLSILVLNFKTFNKLFHNKVPVTDFLLGKLDNEIKGKYINLQTVSGNSKMFVCSVDKAFTIQNSQKKEINILVGVGTKQFKIADCDGLLSPLAL